jgi:hypothetical protein
MLPIRRTILIAAIAAVVLWGRSVAIFSRGSMSTAAPRSLEREIQDIDPRYRLEILREMPEEITALTVSSGQPLNLTGKVFVGTKPIGGVYSFNIMAPNSFFTVGEGLGDYIRSGMCDVNSLAIRDLDRDGIPELLATTSQIIPRGRPRLYAWSLSYPHVLRCMTRPNIRSSWSHGIGFLESKNAHSLSTYVTFCGYGEILEYQFVSGTNDSGFAEDSFRWKQVGQLPVSGEWIQSIDVDHDGQAEICVATGFAPGKAAIHIYEADRPGATLRLEQVIEEAGRFCNVRFLVGDTRGDGVQDVVAWWCREFHGGDSEVVRYRLGPEGIRSRTVLAQGTGELFWPKDGQMTVMDLDGDGYPEIWFANTAGGLWRYDDSHSPPLARIVQIQGEFGPIAPAPATPLTPPALLVAWGRSVLKVLMNPTPTSTSLARRSTIPAR